MLALASVWPFAISGGHVSGGLEGVEAEGRGVPLLPSLEAPDMAP